VVEQSFRQNSGGGDIRSVEGRIVFGFTHRQKLLCGFDIGREEIALFSEEFLQDGNLPRIRFAIGNETECLCHLLSQG